MIALCLLVILVALLVGFREAVEIIALILSRLSRLWRWLTGANKQPNKYRPTYISKI